MVEAKYRGATAKVSRANLRPVGPKTWIVGPKAYKAKGNVPERLTPPRRILDKEILYSSEWCGLSAAIARDSRTIGLNQI